MSNGKRTRSQLTLPNFFNRLQLQRSPLKDARNAIRNTNTPMDSQADEFEDPMTLSLQMKRPSSPSFFASGQSAERELKRSKRETDTDTENDNPQVIRVDPNRSDWKLESFRSPKKPESSSNSQPVPSSPYKSPSSVRARSVPPLSSETSTPIPHLDLRTVPPSPWRSPSKEHRRLRVMSVPPPSPSTEDILDNDKTPTRFMKVDKAKPTPASNAPAPPTWGIGPFDFGKVYIPTKTPSHRVDMALMGPLSPLTPLPPTPFYKAMPDSLELSSTQLPAVFEPPARSTIAPVSRPASPDTISRLSSSTNHTPPPTFSRFPKPPVPPPSGPPSASIEEPSLKTSAASLDVASSSSAAIEQSHPIASSSHSLPSVAVQPDTTNSILSSTSATQPEPLHNPAKPASASKPPSSGATRRKATKPATRPTPVPLGGRMTRSVALRMKERQKKEEVSTGSASLKPRKSMSFSATSSSAMPSTSMAPKSRPSSPVKPASRPDTQSQAIAPTPSSSKTASTSSSNTTTPRRRKSIVPPGNSQRILAFPTQTLKPSRPPSSAEESRPALSNLSTALEKLSLPPPSRPNTSMGFNADTGYEAGKSDIHSKEKATVISEVKDDGGVGRTSIGGGKHDGQLKKGATILSFFAPAGASSSSLSMPAPATKSSAMKPKTSDSATLKRPSSMFINPTFKSTTTVATMGPKASLSAGTLAGGMRGRSGLTTSSRTFGKRPGSVVGTKVFDRVSKMSTLPVVQGSPVKGGSLGSNDHMDELNGTSAGPSRSTIGLEKTTYEQTIDLDHIFGDHGESIEHHGNTDEKGKGKERHGDAWKNASRRASLASQALSQSLSSIPQTPPRVKGSMGPPLVPGRYPGLRSASSSYPSSSSGARKIETAPGVLGRGIDSHVSSGRGDSSGSSKKASGALKVLKECTIFVDVRTDDGDDAGSLFVDMLKGLGARILSRVGQTCTHIVYKNGLTSTLSRYRTLDEPKPLVVGIAWVVECAEQRAKVDETKFEIDLEGVNIAGIVKRRRSMLPKQVPVIPTYLPKTVCSPPGESSKSLDRSVDSELGNHSIETSSSMDDEDNLPPLERARRRRSILVKS